MTPQPRQNGDQNDDTQHRSDIDDGDFDLRAIIKKLQPAYRSGLIPDNRFLERAGEIGVRSGLVRDFLESDEGLRRIKSVTEVLNRENLLGEAKVTGVIDALKSHGVDPKHIIPHHVSAFCTKETLDFSDDAPTAESRARAIVMDVFRIENGHTFPS